MASPQRFYEARYDNLLPGKLTSYSSTAADEWCSGGGSLCRCVATSEWNVEGGRLCVEMAGLSGFVLVDGRWIDGLGLCPRVM